MGGIMVDKRIIIGVKVLSWVFIISSLLEVLFSLSGLKGINFRSYSAIPQDLSLALLIETILIGIIGLVGGIGVLLLLDWGRKVLIAVSIMTIGILVSLPFQTSIAYKNFTAVLSVSFLTYLFQSRFEILFCLFSIYFFTLPSVREKFK